MEKLKFFLLQKNGMMYVNLLLICGLFMGNVLGNLCIYAALFLWMAYLYFSIKYTAKDKKQKNTYKIIFIFPVLFTISFTISIILNLF